MKYNKKKSPPPGPVPDDAAPVRARLHQDARRDGAVLRPGREGGQSLGQEAAGGGGLQRCA